MLPAAGVPRPVVSLHHCMTGMLEDFCWCQVEPALIGLGVCVVLTLIGGAVAAFILARKRSALPLGKRYPGWVLITGSSSGLGKKAALMLVSEQFEGIILHASPKSQKLLEDLAKTIAQMGEGRTKTRVVCADLADTAAVTAMLNEIKDLKVSLLLNNAGYGANGQFDKVDLEAQLKMISVNCSALLQITHHVVSQHRKNLVSSTPNSKPAIAIVNIGSIAAAPCGLPWQTTYAATKAFVSSFSHGIAYSLKQDNVRVVLVEPGTIVDTEFQERSKQPKHSGANTCESVLNAMLDRLRRPTSNYHLIPAFHDNITYYASKFLPDKLILKLGAKRGLEYSPAELR